MGPGGGGKQAQLVYSLCDMMIQGPHLGSPVTIANGLLAATVFNQISTYSFYLSSMGFIFLYMDVLRCRHLCV
jgi:hypothetical protein